MAGTDKKVPVAGVPIIGETAREYWIGNKDNEGEAAMLKLTVTPEQAVQMFGAYVQTLQTGLPPFVFFPWIFTSLATETLREKNAALEARVEELETHVGSLEDRLTALEADAG